MSSLNLFGKEWGNIVFENRNKLYGAYKLRQESAKTTFMALAIGIGTLSMIFGSSYLYASNSKEVIISCPVSELEPVEPVTIIEADLTKVEPIVEKAKGTEDDATKASATKTDVMDNKKLTNVNITEDDKVKKDDLTAQSEFNDHTNSSSENLNANKKGTLNTDGSKSGTENTEKGNDTTGSGSNDGEENIKGNEIVKLVQKKAAPTEGFEKFFESYIRKFSAKDLGGSETEMVVKLKFVVEKDGSFTDIKIVEDKHGLGNEAIRVLKSMPKWKAAQHNGRTVRSQFTLPIKVKVNN
ncbi:MAG: energy transducer TonB [Myroides sp.]